MERSHGRSFQSRQNAPHGHPSQSQQRTNPVNFPSERYETDSRRGNRADEIFSALKSEFDNLQKECTSAKHARADLERQLQAQILELSTIQQTLYDLQQQHLNMKQQYEDELARLRNKYNSGGSEPTKSTGRSAPSPSLSSSYPSNLEKKSSNFSSNRFRDNEDSGSVPKLAGLAAAAQLRDDDHSSTQQSFNPPPISSLDRNSEVNGNGSGQSSSASSSNRSSSPQPNGRATAGGSGMSMPLQADSDWTVDYPVGSSGISVELSHDLQHSSVVCCSRFSHDGKYLATGCNRSAQIYDVETGKQMNVFHAPSDEKDLYIRCVGFSPDGRFLACGGEDKVITLWDLHNRENVHTFTGHESEIYSLDYSQETIMASGSGDKKTKIWDVRALKCLHTLGNDEVGPKDLVTSVALSPDGQLVAVGSLDKIVRLWDVQRGYFRERYEGHANSVYSVAFSPDGKTLASASLDMTLKLWDMNGTRSRNRCRTTFTGHSDFVLSVAFSYDGKFLISGSKDRSVLFWEPRTATNTVVLRGHKNSVISVATSPVGNGLFATGSGDKKARIWRYDA